MPVETFKSLREAGTSGAWLRRSVLIRVGAFLALTVPLPWTMVGVERRQLDKIAEQQSQVDVLNLAHAFSEEVNASFSTVDMSLLHLRTHWGHATFAEAVRRLDRDLRGRLPLLVAVTDARGKLVFSSSGVSAPVDLSDREHIRYHLDGSHGDELFVSRPVFGRVTHKWVVEFTRPLYGRDGRVQGVIVASVEPSYFARFYADIDLGPGASIALVRRDGTIIARTTRAGGNRDMGRVLQGPPYHDVRPFVPEHPASGTFSRLGQVDHVERLYAWRQLPSYPLMVTVGQAVGDVHARYARQKHFLIGAGVAATCMLTLVGWMAIAASDNRRRAVDALAAAEARWKLALHAAGEGVWECNFATRTVTLSPEAQAIVEADTATVRLTRKMLQRSLHEEDLARAARALQEHVDGVTPDYVVEHRVRLRSGHWRWILARGMVAERTKDGKPLRMIGIVADIDARKSAEEQIFHQAYHDALTGLPNRLLFEDRLNQAIRAAQRERAGVAVLYFDLDRFKPVNDTYGHAVGDGLLVEVARRVSASLRESDTLARLGGDEFVVLLPRCAGPGQAHKVAENILAQLNRPYSVENHVLHISGSIGYALFPENGRDGEALLRSADLAMYSAKTSGRGRVSGPDQAEAA